MTRKKKPLNEILIFKAIGLTAEQWDWVDGQVHGLMNQGRGYPIRKMISTMMETEREMRESMVFSSNLDQNLQKIATFDDFERVYDQYRGVLDQKLAAIGSNGGDLRPAVIAFKGSVWKLLKKTAFDEQIHSFLLSKMEEAHTFS